ncbi:MAG: hypothetical protein AAF135_19780 [Bacteroidota bacterium]
MKKPVRIPSRSRLKSAKQRTQHTQQKARNESVNSRIIKKALEVDWDD